MRGCLLIKSTFFWLRHAAPRNQHLRNRGSARRLRETDPWLGGSAASRAPNWLSTLVRRPTPPPGIPRSSVWLEVARDVRFWRKIGVWTDLAPAPWRVRARAAEFERPHGRAMGRPPPDRTEQNPRGKVRRGTTRTATKPPKAVGGPPRSGNAMPTPTTRRGWRVINANYKPNEGTQTPPDCALTR